MLRKLVFIGLFVSICIFAFAEDITIDTVNGEMQSIDFTDVEPIELYRNTASNGTLEIISFGMDEHYRARLSISFYSKTEIDYDTIRYIGAKQKNVEDNVTRSRSSGDNPIVTVLDIIFDNSDFSAPDITITGFEDRIIITANALEAIESAYQKMLFQLR